MNNNFNGSLPPDMKNLLNSKGIDPKSRKKEDADKLLGSLSKSDAEKINKLLSDRKALDNFLNSKQAEDIMKALFGKK